eukprot:CAMPEP_0185746172 /NCGR_PEP_ID=MMETSP1174-20130828/4632_1 /TAXON_ID=35687 /ORGANISM="Dictyocha speculum, Strain CCMP1381" /LENGTH=123 /DNA_ID=CAMNT_0028420629 /DNA_START=120 /DNA_END=491 /DNA_ORIENTATION=+
MGLFDDPAGWFKRNLEVVQDGRKAQASHILIPIPTSADIEPTMEKLCEIKAMCTDQDQFRELAKEYSSCPSAQIGGRLGEFGRGTMAPKFDDVVFTEEVGTVQGPVRTIYGGHLIWIESRTEK